VKKPTEKEVFLAVLGPAYIMHLEGQGKPYNPSVENEANAIRCAAVTAARAVTEWQLAFSRGVFAWLVKS